jgi:ferric-dicitrate binding protein FerR (iron transport regulator)
MSDIFPPDPPSERRAWRTDAAWHRLRERLDSAEATRVDSSATHRLWGTRTHWLSAAATIVIAVGATLAVSKHVAKRVVSAPEIRTATTAAGERVVVHLADGSLITLGPASTIRSTLAPDRRDIDLVGLADFKVVHDSARPFIVRAKNAVTADVGTEFVVRAYPSDSVVQVAVTSGMVALSGRDRSHAVQLRAGHLGQVGMDGVASRLTSGNASARAAWVDGRLVFDDERLTNVATELSRWFDVDIRVSSGALAQRRLSAVYNSPSLTGVLEALTMTLDARYERNGRIVTILPRSR